MDVANLANEKEELNNQLKDMQQRECLFFFGEIMSTVHVLVIYVEKAVKKKNSVMKSSDSRLHHNNLSSSLSCKLLVI